MELMLTVFIVGIVAAIALPSFNYAIANNRMSSTANNVVGAFNLARVEAAQRGQNVNIGSISAGTNWGAQGYRIYLDANGDGDWDAGEQELRIFETVANGLTLTATAGGAGINFNAVGFASAVATLQLCSNESAVSDRQIDISLSGRVAISQITCP